MQIRRARAEEAPTLGTIAQQAKASWPYSKAQLQAWRDDLTISSAFIAASWTFVAEIDGRIAGFYALCEVQGTWQLEHLWVAQDSMRQGVGRRLLMHAMKHATERGAHSLHIDAEPYAEPFYLACGALRVGVVDAPLEGWKTRQRPQLVLAMDGAGNAGDR